MLRTLARNTGRSCRHKCPSLPARCRRYHQGAQATASSALGEQRRDALLKLSVPHSGAVRYWFRPCGGFLSQFSSGCRFDEVWSGHWVHHLFAYGDDFATGVSSRTDESAVCISWSVCSCMAACGTFPAVSCSATAILAQLSLHGAFLKLLYSTEANARVGTKWKLRMPQVPRY